MAETSTGRLSVLWATDGSPQAMNALPLLREMVLPATSHLYVLSVAPHALLSGARPDPAFVTRVTRKARTQALTAAQHAAAAHATALDPGVAVDLLARWGHPIREILRVANGVKADLTVLSAKGHSNLRLLLLGSVSHGVAQLSTRPLLIARPGAAALRTVVVGYHPSQAGRKALAFLDRLALPPSARLVLVNVVEPFAVPHGTQVAYRRRALAEAHRINERRHRQATQMLEGIASRLEAAGRPVAIDVVSGAAGSGLMEAAQRHEADLAVVGSRKPSAARHFLLGSTAEKLVRHSDASVLVVR